MLQSATELYGTIPSKYRLLPLAIDQATDVKYKLPHD